MTEVEVKWSPSALRSLEEIRFYITNEAKSEAPDTRFIEKIVDRTDQLSFFPESGQKQLNMIERGINCRYIIEGNYKIIYEYAHSPELVIILDIFHTSQDPIKLNK
jgi:plasmid stabilization system protein ParE